MTEYEGSIAIDRPPEVVWSYVSDLAATPRWRTTVHRVEPPAELVPGASFDATTKVVGKTWQWRLTLDEFDPPNTLTYSVAEGFTDITVTYRLAPAGAATRFTLVASSQPRRRVERLLEPIAGRVLRRQTDQHLANLRAIVEAGDDRPE